jgi:hypothetical protein
MREPIATQAIETIVNIANNAPPKVIAPLLIKAIKDDDKYMRFHIAVVFTYTIEHLGSETNSAISALISSLDDEFWLVRCYAAQALIKLGPQVAHAVPNIIRAINKESEYDAKEWLVRALEVIGPQAISAVPVLIAIVNNKDENESVRKAANLALKAIKGEK